MTSADRYEAVSRAIALFRYREQATGRSLPSNPNWAQAVSESIDIALAGARGETDQEQCIYQAIRWTVWEQGGIYAPWTKAFPRAARLEETQETVASSVCDTAPLVASPETRPQGFFDKLRAWIVDLSRRLKARWNNLRHG